MSTDLLRAATAAAVETASGDRPGAVPLLARGLQRDDELATSAATAVLDRIPETPAGIPELELHDEVA